MDPAIFLKRSGDDLSLDEPPYKRPRTDLSCSLGKLKLLSEASAEEFSKGLSSDPTAIHSLFDTLQETLVCQSESKELIESFKPCIKVIQIRLASHKDEDLVKKVNKLLFSLKTKENSHLSTIQIHQAIPALIDVEGAFVDALWKEGHIDIAQEMLMYELVISEELENAIDDYMLRLILEKSDSDQIKKVTCFDLDCPKLTREAVKLLLTFCPDIENISFRSLLDNPKFCDHTLQIEGQNILVNKALVSHFSPYFQKLFNSSLKEGLAIQHGATTTELSTVEFQATQDCMNFLIGAYNPKKETDINRAIDFLHHLMLFELNAFSEEAELAIGKILDGAELSDDELSQVLCDLNGHFMDYLYPLKLPTLRKKMVDLAQPILDEKIVLVEKEGVAGLVLLLRELKKKDFPCSGITRMINESDLREPEVAELLTHMDPICYERVFEKHLLEKRVRSVEKEGIEELLSLLKELREKKTNCFGISWMIKENKWLNPFLLEPQVAELLVYLDEICYTNALQG